MSRPRPCVCLTAVFLVLCRRPGEDGHHEPRGGVRPVGLRERAGRRAVLQRGRLHDGAAAGGRGGDRVVVGALGQRRGLRPPKPAGGESFTREEPVIELFTLYQCLQQNLNDSSDYGFYSRRL